MYTLQISILYSILNIYEKDYIYFTVMHTPLTTPCACARLSAISCVYIWFDVICGWLRALIVRHMSSFRTKVNGVRLYNISCIMLTMSSPVYMDYVKIPRVYMFVKTVRQALRAQKTSLRASI